MSLRHSGVEVVPQLLLSKIVPRMSSYEHNCPEIEAERGSAIVVIVMSKSLTDKVKS